MQRQRSFFQLVEAFPIAAFGVCFGTFLLLLAVLERTSESGPRFEHHANVTLSYRVRTYTPLGGASETVYGKRTALAALARNGFSRLVADDEWDLLWTLNPQTRFIVPRELTWGGPAVPQLAHPQRPRVANNCYFFLAAGQKCQFAGHLNAMRRVLGDVAAMDGHLDVYRWRSADDMARFLPIFNAPERPVFVQKACTMSRGRGIDFVRRPELRSVEFDDAMFPPVNASFVFQRNIDRPLLDDGHKFHVRVYLLVTSYHPVRISLFNDGLMFRAARKIAGATAADRDAFLSNRAVSGSQSDRLLSWFWEHVGAARSTRMRARLRRALVQLVALYVPISSTLQHLSSFDVYPYDWRVTADVDTHEPASTSNKLGCFDLFGVDVMFDEDDNPFILEINAGPSMDSPRLAPRHGSTLPDDDDEPTYTAHDATFDANNAVKRRMLTNVMALARRFVEGTRAARTERSATELAPLLTFDECADADETRWAAWPLAAQFCAQLRRFREAHCARQDDQTFAECSAELESLFATLYHYREHALHRAAPLAPSFDWFPDRNSSSSSNSSDAAGAVNGFTQVFPAGDAVDDDMYDVWVEKRLAPFTSLDQVLWQWAKFLAARN